MCDNSCRLARCRQYERNRRETVRMQRGCAVHHEGAGERQEATSDTFIVFHAVTRYTSILHMRNKAIITLLVVVSSGSPPHALAFV